MKSTMEILTKLQENSQKNQTSVYKGYKRDKIEMMDLASSM